MSDTKPGDVALVLNKHGVWNTAICVVGIPNNYWQYGVSQSTAPLTAATRPLVVIDPDNASHVQRLYTTLSRENRHALSVGFLSLRAALREFAAPTPPKPDEPQGLGAVVEDTRGIRFVRTYSVKHDAPWVSGNHRRPWAEIHAVRVLSEGVTP